MGLSLRPQHLKRYKDLAMLFMKYGKNDIVTAAGLEEVVRDEKTDGKAIADTSDLSKDLEKLGPTYIKLGQFLSTRTDILPQQYIEELEKLQDQVTPVPFSEVETIINKEIAMRFSKAFQDFDVEPIGTASIGQVHKAVLRNGKHVVVKIQRPNIREQILDDLDVLDEVSEFLDAHTEAGKKYMLNEMINEFRKAMLRELDYRNEKQNLKILAENLKEFTQIIIPHPVEDYSTSKVITMDLIQGIKVTSISPLKKLDINGKELAEILFKSYLKQILIDGFYHCDPHPGNVFITDNNMIALIDLGMVGYTSAEIQTQLIHILLAIGDGRGDEVTERVVNISTKTDSFKKDEFRKSINEMVSIQKSATLENLQIGKVIIEITKMCGRNGVHVSSELTMLGKTLLNLDKVGKTLDPNFNPNEAIRRNADELMKKKFVKSASSQKPYEILLESKEFLEKLPSRVNKILDKVTNDEVEFKVKAFDEIYLMDGLQKIANRITLGLILAALIMGAAMIMRLQTSFTIFGYPGLAMIFFLLAALGGIILAFRILFKDEASVKKKS